MTLSHHPFPRPPWRCAAALALLPIAHAVQAQASATALPTVTVSGRSAPAPASVTGFGDVPLSRTPMQASVFGSEQLQDANVQRLSDLTRLAPGISDAYNSVGYIDYLTVRGYVLDNRFN
ncbi:MAG TPA: TonB-dependent siderophore receptor, partial [Caldimonas sp.]|nr:TonB-dependent siderophore receptor [Caldimonas sp.]